MNMCGNQSRCRK